MTVAIPARNEAAGIVRCLAALAAQRDLAGRPLAPGSIDVIVYANSCTDATAEVAATTLRAYPGLAGFVVAQRLPPGSDHVGVARKSVMDVAARRCLEAGSPRALVASLDADTVVDSDWVAQSLLAAQHADAVAGHVFVDARDVEQLAAGVRRLYALEATFRALSAELEALLDPLDEDPLPRHGTFVGASFAVAAGTYVAAGGVPPLPRLEDRAFMFALRRIDARIRFALSVRAATSGRRTARVAGGFGAERDDLHRRAERGESFLVEHPAGSIAKLRGRAALRKLWNGTAGACDLDVACRIFGWSAAALRRAARLPLPFGAVYERVVAIAPVRETYAPIRVEAALAGLRSELNLRKTAVATRTSAASGAG